MQPFATHAAIAAPLLKDDVNTDQIAPILNTRSLKEDYRAMLFHRARRREDGSEDADFVLNKPQFRSAGILVTGNNFGAGSSRESAVWSMLANIRSEMIAIPTTGVYRLFPDFLLLLMLSCLLNDLFHFSYMEDNR